MAIVDCRLGYGWGFGCAEHDTIHNSLGFQNLDERLSHYVGEIGPANSLLYGGISIILHKSISLLIYWSLTFFQTGACLKSTGTPVQWPM